jgi:hypothetical protein
MRSVLTVAALAVLTTGCVHHQISFNTEEPTWHYLIDGSAIDVPIVVSVPTETQAADLEISSFAAGLAHRWHANYGKMFMQALEVELSQLFPSHTLSTSRASPGSYHLHLDIPSYAYSGFAARTTVEAVLTDPSGAELLRKRYEATGKSGTGKVVGLGAFGMKSAIRQSTLDAYRQIFGRLRADLRSSLPALRIESQPS